MKDVRENYVRGLRLFRSARLLTALALACVAFLPVPASAVLRIDITQGNVEPLPIAISAFVDTSGEGIGGAIGEVITSNLERSGLFAAIDPAFFIQKPEDMQVQPRFVDWRLIDAQALISGSVELRDDGRLKIEFRLWDVFSEQHMTGLVYSTTTDNWRRVAHLISDAVYARLTGESGYFDTRIVYVAESGPAELRVKRLAIMDQDGENSIFLTDGSHMVLTPRFSPTAQEVTYLSYFLGRPRVYIYNIDTGQQEVLGDFDEMSFAPRFSPDGNRVIMSLAIDGNSDVYIMDLRTRLTERLTQHPAIDTSPSYSPDGESVVFTSDRGGTPQLYVMAADGGRPKRISFGNGSYSTPVWSPRGDLVAFTKQLRGQFFIGVIRPDGTGERLLTAQYLVEGPTWAPNGRVIMFFRQSRRNADGSGGETRLWSIDLTGYNERRIVTPMDASDPAWSPLRQ